LKFEVHIFTNSTPLIKTLKTIEGTFNSIYSKFPNLPKPTVWIDPNPNVDDFQEYKTFIQKTFNVQVNETKGLADGYIKAIKSSTSDFLLMMEHDWEFTDSLTHSIEEIAAQMEKDSIHHMRFNKFHNPFIPNGWEDYYRPQLIKSDIIDYYTIKSLSNNPHIINRNLYITDILPLIDNKYNNGSYGIEDYLRYNPINPLYNEYISLNIKGAIYGNVNLPSTVIHTDGRKHTPRQV